MILALVGAGIAFSMSEGGFSLKKDQDVYKESGKVEGFQITDNPELIPIDPSQFTQTYSSRKYGFSFNYPEGHRVGNFQGTNPDGTEKETIVVQDADNLQGFQIIISTFDEDIDITEGRIKRDIFDIKMEDRQTVQLGSARKGLAFISDNDSYGGASREVWFVYRGHLYQVSTYASLDALLQQVLNTWRFE